MRESDHQTTRLPAKPASQPANQPVLLPQSKCASLIFLNPRLLSLGNIPATIELQAFSCNIFSVIEDPRPGFKRRNGGKNIIARMNPSLEEGGRRFYTHRTVSYEWRTVFDEISYANVRDALWAARSIFYASNGEDIQLRLGYSCDIPVALRLFDVLGPFSRVKHYEFEFNAAEMQLNPNGFSADGASASASVEALMWTKPDGSQVEMIGSGDEVPSDQHGQDNQYCLKWLCPECQFGKYCDKSCGYCDESASGNETQCVDRNSVVKMATGYTCPELLRATGVAQKSRSIFDKFAGALKHEFRFDEIIAQLVVRSDLKSVYPTLEEFNIALPRAQYDIRHSRNGASWRLGLSEPQTIDLASEKDASLRFTARCHSSNAWGQSKWRKDLSACALGIFEPAVGIFGGIFQDGTVQIKGKTSDDSFFTRLLDNRHQFLAYMANKRKPSLWNVASSLVETNSARRQLGADEHYEWIKEVINDYSSESFENNSASQCAAMPTSSRRRLITVPDIDRDDSCFLLEYDDSFRLESCKIYTVNETTWETNVKWRTESYSYNTTISFLRGLTAQQNKVSWLDEDKRLLTVKYSTKRGLSARIKMINFEKNETAFSFYFNASDASNETFVAVTGLEISEKQVLSGDFTREESGSFVGEIYVYQNFLGIVKNGTALSTSGTSIADSLIAKFTGARADKDLFLFWFNASGTSLKNFVVATYLSVRDSGDEVFKGAVVVEDGAFTGNIDIRNDTAVTAQGNYTEENNKGSLSAAEAVGTFASEIEIWTTDACDEADAPTFMPSGLPSLYPTTSAPTVTPKPTLPLDAPTSLPTTTLPTSLPTSEPTLVPTLEPTIVPTIVPTLEPTLVPTIVPTIFPTPQPTPEPTISMKPTLVPTYEPTLAPTPLPTPAPTLLPTGVPSLEPTLLPTRAPTLLPTFAPTLLPTGVPSVPGAGRRLSLDAVTPEAKGEALRRELLTTLDDDGLHGKERRLDEYSNASNASNASNPYNSPTSLPTLDPTTAIPTLMPTSQPTPIPTLMPTSQPSPHPTPAPSPLPSLGPTAQPTLQPSLAPSGLPSLEPTVLPSLRPSPAPSSLPSLGPTAQPTLQPSLAPSGLPSLEPTVLPSLRPSPAPSSLPSLGPTSAPTVSSVPTHLPTPPKPAQDRIRMDTGGKVCLKIGLDTEIEFRASASFTNDTISLHIPSFKNSLLIRKEIETTIEFVANDRTLRAAVEAWCSDVSTAKGVYGHISNWDTSLVTNVRTSIAEQICSFLRASLTFFFSGPVCVRR
jgi:hypothetical protein